MPENIVFNAVFPLGDTAPDALPARQIGPAVGYYTHCLGFSLIAKDQQSAILRRDNVEIGLAVNGEDPEQASCYFAVSDVEALWRELNAKGIEPSPLGVQEHEGKPYRVFFAADPYGVCFCFGQPA